MALVVIAVAAFFVLNPSASRRTGGQSSTTAGQGRPPATGGRPAGAPPPVHIPKSYPISTMSMVLDEPSTAAIANAHTASGSPVRALPVTVRFPVSPTGSGPVPGAPFPLIVFSQGFDESAGAYGGLMSSWAHAGYVVAAPTYPFTAPNGQTEINETDIVNHPADLRFVIAALSRMARSPASRLHQLLDPSRVAVAGQSDGGDVSLAVGANSCCRDGVVKAAVILSGAELASFGGTYFSGGSVPLLVTQGDQDTINPPGCSAQLYNQAPQPKYYLNISGAQHLPPYVSRGPARTGVERVTIAFLNAYVKQKPSGLDALRRGARLPGGEQLTSAATAPQPASTYCPGAP